MAAATKIQSRWRAFAQAERFLDVLLSVKKLQAYARMAQAVHWFNHRKECVTKIAAAWRCRYAIVAFERTVGGMFT